MMKSMPGTQDENNELFQKKHMFVNKNTYIHTCVHGVFNALYIEGLFSHLGNHAYLSTDSPLVAK